MIVRHTVSSFLDGQCVPTKCLLPSQAGQDFQDAMSILLVFENPRPHLHPANRRLGGLEGAISSKGQVSR